MSQTFHLFRKHRQYVVQIIHNTVVGNGENRRFRILVDRDNRAGVFHSRHVSRSPYVELIFM